MKLYLLNTPKQFIFCEKFYPSFLKAIDPKNIKAFFCYRSHDTVFCNLHRSLNQFFMLNLTLSGTSAPGFLTNNYRSRSPLMPV